MKTTLDEIAAFSDLRQQLRTQTDQEWQEIGATYDELEISRRLSNLFACEIEAGRSPDEIEARWESKTAEQILAEYALPQPSIAALV